ncbi:hypothetical protein OC835_005353 [Tilletia horrida]|uniref:Uncharacterized protein n=1 Tax=Tilletia horrida TaxID=155126 RepID=A0AAN6G796_9BASI|nr:hypothetical protein OC842_006761 [Tilletia horrida]KAK0526235.1 hypothetical protein OC835_005353 [Tilletia horrida]
MSGSSLPQPRDAATAGLPPPLREHIAVLETTFENCGKMTETLGRLGDLVDLLEQTVHTKELDVDQALEDLHSDIEAFRSAVQQQVKRIEDMLSKALHSSQQEFMEAQDRSRKEFADLLDKNRVKFETLQEQAVHTVDEVRLRADDGFSVTFKRLEGRLRAIGVRHGRDMARAMGQIRECSGAVMGSVRQTQSTWIRAQSQLVGLNTWAVAWPEAIRTVQQHHRRIGLSPPEYNRVDAHATGERRPTTEADSQGVD